jgi:membrane-bound lytic murein transglycosylase F
MSELSPRAYRIQFTLGLIAVSLVVLFLVVRPQMEAQKLSELERIQATGKLRILTLNSASTYYQGRSSAGGFEYQLANWFAESIGVEPVFTVVPQYADLYPELLFGSGDLISAGLSEDESRFSPLVDYSPPYYQTRNQLVYKKNQVESPESLYNIIGSSLKVLSGTRHSKLLHDQQTKFKDLIWIEAEDIATEELIEQVNDGLVDFIVASSHEIALQHRYFPELRIAFEIGEEVSLRWAFNRFEENSLKLALTQFFSAIEADGRLAQLVHRHYGHVEKFNYSDVQTFSQNIEERLPKYREYFIEASNILDLDWRLLAAIGYQESLWNPRAKSPTGVRGLMMLTRITATQVGVENRLDAQQSIHGGAKYFEGILKRIPDRITDPDRAWFALASYNVGFGHLEDARIITQSRGGNPDRWIDVKKSLPLLAREKWYKKTKYGYARGWEPVKYVENIRLYYDHLVGIEDRNNREIKIPDDQASDSIIAPSL